jgi:hypothetical protein
MKKTKIYIHKQQYCDRARDLMHKGRKLEAVKLIWTKKRNNTFGLREAKDFVDSEIFKEKL